MISYNTDSADLRDEPNTSPWRRRYRPAVYRRKKGRSIRKKRPESDNLIRLSRSVDDIDMVIFFVVIYY